MAATNFTPISLYYSATAASVPTAGNLVAGELALNTADGRLFYKDSAGVVQTLASKSTTSGVFTSITDSGLTSGRVTYATTGGLLTDSASLQFNGTNLGVGAAPIGTVRQYIKGTGTTSSTFPLYIDDSSGTNLFTLTDAGNVGIGTNSPATFSAYTKLSVLNGVAVGVDASNAGRIVGSTTTGTELSYLSMGGNYNIGSTGEIALATTTAKSILFGTNGSERMRITSAGSVGIGTSSPTQVLDVRGNIYTNNALLFGGNISAPTADASVYRTADNTLAFATGSTERMRIDSSGNLIVGATSAYNGAVLNVKNTVSGTQSVAIYNSGASATNYFMSFAAGSTYSEKGFITWNGSTVAIAQVSDKRLKENIEDAPSAISKINDIKIRSFDFKEDNRHVDYGVVAQELVNVVPSAVFEGTDNEDGSINKSWSVGLEPLIPILVKAMQEQQALIESLTTRLTALENK